MRLIGLILLYFGFIFLACGFALSVSPAHSSEVPAAKPLHTYEYVSTVPLSFFAADAKEWDDLEKQMVQTNADTIVMDWQGEGGEVVRANHFYRAMIFVRDILHKTIFLNIIGPAISAHGLAACFASQVNIEPGASITLHPIQTMLGSAKIATLQKDYSTLQSWAFDECIKKGLITPAEKHDMAVNFKRVTIFNDGSETGTKHITETDGP